MVSSIAILIIYTQLYNFTLLVLFDNTHLLAHSYIIIVIIS